MVGTALFVKQTKHLWCISGDTCGIVQLPHHQHCAIDEDDDCKDVEDDFSILEDFLLCSIAHDFTVGGGSRKWRRAIPYYATVG
jgi:hypothetical protein